MKSNKRICRLCLSRKGNLQPLFDATDVDLPKKIWQCTTVKVKYHAGLPRFICEVCKSKLIIWMKFQKMCLKNNDILHEHFPNYFEKPVNYDNHLVSKDITESRKPVNDNQPEIKGRIENIQFDETENEKINSVNILMTLKDEQIEYTVENDGHESIKNSNSTTERIIQMEIQTNPHTGENEDADEMNLLAMTKDYVSNINSNKNAREIKKILPSDNRIRYVVKCSICEKYQQNIKQHMRIHFDEKPFKCPYCDRSFRQRGNYSRHVNIHTGRKPYKCAECEAAFADPASLRAHKVRHTGTRSYQCDVCDKSFGHSHVLAAHKRIHTQDRRHYCNFCEKRFLSSHALKKHIRTHTGEKPYMCQLCPKTFATSGNLGTHQKVHTKEKPFKCVICNNTFAYRCVLKTHLQTHKDNFQVNDNEVNNFVQFALNSTNKTNLNIKNDAPNENGEVDHEVYEIYLDAGSIEDVKL